MESAITLGTYACSFGLMRANINVIVLQWFLFCLFAISSSYHTDLCVTILVIPLTAFFQYMSDASWQVIRVVDEFNAEDRIRAAYTFDAGPNACIFLEEKNVPVFLEQLCRQFVVAPEIVTSLSSSGDVRLSTLVAPPKSTFSVRNIIVSRVGGSPRVVG